MGPDEIVSRLKQEVAKKIDSHGLFLPRFDLLPAVESRYTGRFFFDAEEIPQRIHVIRENVPDFERNVLDHAEQILKHQFPLLGYGPLGYGKEIDWHLDIVSGKRAPLRPWPKINYLDFNALGDCKVTWELSRHQFLVTLAKAWLLTGEERFVRKLESIYYDWHKKNPYPLGINWASSLEVAFRSLSWIWVRELLGGCGVAAHLRQDIMHALGFNAWYIRRYLSTYFSPNTHLQGEAVALFFIGTLCPSLPDASDWRETGWNILLEHARSKVLEDGAYFEQSTYYHVYALDFFLHARILANRNGTPFPSSYDDVLKRMLEHLSFLCQAGPPPRFGDDDGGRVFDGHRNRAEHLLDPLAIGTALYRLNNFKQPGVKATEEMLWLLGEEEIRAFSVYPEWKSGSSARFPHTGLYISYTKEDSRSQIVLDAGPLGGGSGGHGHADALSLTLNLDGKPLLVDPGACNYVGPGSDRDDFRATHAHNTVTVDGLSQAEPRTSFSWFWWPEVQVEAIAFTPEFEFIAASHDGYARLQPPVTHRRALFASREGFWLVLDELVSDGPHDYALHWHLAPGSHVEQQAGDRWVVELEGSKLHFLTASDGWLRTVESGWFSPAYGGKQAAPVVSVTKRAQGNETIATLLWAGRLNSPAPTLTALSQSLGIPAYRLTIGASRSILIFGDGVTTIKIEGWESDAKFLYGILDADGCPFRVISVQSNFVRYDGKTLHESKERVPHFVWRQTVSS
jgi:hypothetical protein